MHINRISANVNRTLGFFKRNMKIKHTAAYTTLVRSQVEYASSVWSPYTRVSINKIEMVQRRAVPRGHSYMKVIYMCCPEFERGEGLRELPPPSKNGEGAFRAAPH